MKTFIIVFGIAILFVIGSAGMMKYFDKRHAIKRHNDDTPDH